MHTTGASSAPGRFQSKAETIEKITEVLEKETLNVPNAEKLLALSDVGLITAAGFLAAVGEIQCFNLPKQIQKLTGLELKENRFGQRHSRSSISKNGRKQLRKFLVQVMLPIIPNNAEHCKIYQYFTTRQKNPLKGNQAIIVAGCRLIRVFYVILKHGVDCDPKKFMSDIIYPTAEAA